MYGRYSDTDESVEQIVPKGHITEEKWQKLDDRAKETAAPISCVLCGDTPTLDPNDGVVCRPCNVMTYFQAVCIDGVWMLQPWVEETGASDIQMLKHRALEHSQPIKCLSCENPLIPNSGRFLCATCEVETYFQCVHIEGTPMIQRQVSSLNTVFYETPVSIVFPTASEKNATTPMELLDTSKSANEILQELIEEKGVPRSTAYRQTQSQRRQEVAALKAEAIRLNKETHLSLEEIGRRVGRDKSTASRWSKDHRESDSGNTAGV